MPITLICIGLDVTSDIEKPEMLELDSCNVRNVWRLLLLLHFIVTGFQRVV